MPENVISIKSEPNYYVTEHFMYSDFICPCCDVLKIIPGFYRHVRLLEELRQGMGGMPLIVTSGYRCSAHNKKIGGAARSWHMLFATDIQPGGDNRDRETMKALHTEALELGFGGIGLYEAHIHLDLRPDRITWAG